MVKREVFDDKTTWTCVDDEYICNKVVFILKDNELSFVLSGRYCSLKFYSKIFFFNKKTAVDVIQEYEWVGRHFEEAALRVYKDMGLHLGYTVPVLRDI